MEHIGPYWESHWPETVVHRIHHIALMAPQDTAVRFGSAFSSYEELFVHANAIKSALYGAFNAAGLTVAVMVDPGSDFIASLLGVLRAGAIYLPLDLS
jgi:hybrid polyketide synthase / nonribosomal peptide synthetase ACE1